jgi:oligoribonuclease (3'-5' exoribonuclease)
VADLLVWIDCEMTGLDLGKDKLIEVAALVTDPDLKVLGDGIDLVIHADDAALDTMPEIVRDMHAKSGLTEEVRRSSITMAEAEEAVLAYVREFVPNPRTAPLCGNSIATDRGFLTRDMPTSARASANSSTTGARSSSRCPARTSTRHARSPPSCKSPPTRRATRSTSPPGVWL